MEQFRFETVQPSSVTVSTDEYVKERLDELTVTVRHLARMQQNTNTPRNARRNSKNDWVTIHSETADFSQSHAEAVEIEIDEMDAVVCHVEQINEERYKLTVRALRSAENDFVNILSKVIGIIEKAKDDYLPF